MLGDQMTEYTQIYKSYSSIVKKCVLTSQKYAGIPAPSNQHFYAAILFTKLCTISNSIQKLSPLPDLLGENAHWDYASVASLTRNLIECYLTLFYLSIQKCSKDESEARLLLMNLHDHISREKMFKSVEDDKRKEIASRISNEVTSSLKNNLWFRALSDKQQKHYLKGHNAYFKKQDEIVEASGEDLKTFRFIYRFLSNNTHSFPMGFYRMRDGSRGNRLESEIEISYTSSCLQWAEAYLNKANKEFKELFSTS